MRISTFETFKSQQLQLSGTQGQSASLVNQISTGKIFNRASEEPVRMNKVMLLNTSERRLEQLKMNASDSASSLKFLDQAYDSMSDVLVRGQELAIQGANETYSPEERQVIAASVEGLISTILGVANSTHLDRYVFSGQMLKTEPISYDGTNFVYNGNDSELQNSISETITVTVTQNAEDVVIPALESLVKLRDALNTNDTAGINASIADLDTTYKGVVDQRSKVGVELASINLLDNVYANTLTDLTAKRSDYEDVDLTKAISDYTYLQTIYQASVSVSSKLLKTSILDYI